MSLSLRSFLLAQAGFRRPESGGECPYPSCGRADRHERSWAWQVCRPGASRCRWSSCRQRTSLTPVRPAVVAGKTCSGAGQESGESGAIACGHARGARVAVWCATRRGP